ncbi:hypothetical protein M3Y99_00503000 [Aphelenchoides fujianensis]|nr:hypothetical protein M3Y99_00503000 [Aphelenchoides fujianensis]
MDSNLDVSERSESSSPSPIYRRDVHAHYDRIGFSQLAISLIRECHQLNCYKFRFLVQCDGVKWEIQRSSGDLVDLDETLHNCTFSRRFSRLPVLSAEMFALSDVLSRKQRLLHQGEIRNSLSNYMTRLSNILQRDDFRLSCMNALQFMEVNNKGKRDGNPVPMPSAFLERADVRKKCSKCDQSSSSKHGRVFGVDLAKHVDHCVESVPCILVDSTQFIENKLALGVYRVSGSMSQMNQLKRVFKEIYDNKKGSNYEFERISCDVHVVACLLKHFFRTLPNRLFGSFSSACINSFARSTAVEEQIRGARELSRRLSSANFRTAAYLMRHLAFVAENVSFTKMEATALALVWSPNLFRVKSPRDQVSSLSAQNILVQVMIKYHKEIFYDVPLSNDESFVSCRSNGGLSAEVNEINGHCNEDTDSIECKSNGALITMPNESLSPRYYKRVRSEEPIGTSIVDQMKRNIKAFGSNVKCSFRNLVRLNNRGTNSPTSSNSCVEFFTQTPRDLNEHSTTSLNIPMSPALKRENSGSCGFSNYSGADSEYTAMFSFHNFNAPKAELDAISVDSIPFDASRYDNIERR